MHLPPQRTVIDIGRNRAVRNGVSLMTRGASLNVHHHLLRNRVPGGTDSHLISRSTFGLPPAPGLNADQAMRQ
jgi:hypothetical protein